MTKEVLLTLKGLQFGEDGPEDVTTCLPAEYYERGGKHYVVYEEVMEGFTKPVKSILKFWKEELDVTRHGVVNVHLLFKKGQKYPSEYTTPFGSFQVGVDTTKLELKQESEKIALLAEYRLEMNEQHLAECRLTLEICPRKEKERQ